MDSGLCAARTRMERGKQPTYRPAQKTDISFRRDAAAERIAPAHSRDSASGVCLKDAPNLSECWLYRMSDDLRPSERQAAELELALPQASARLQARVRPQGWLQE